MNLRELIDQVEEDNQSRAKLEEKIEFLNEERKRLLFTVNEQKKLIEEMGERVSEEEDIPEDVNILKDLVKSQREELNQKDEQIAVFKESIMELTSQLSRISEEESNKIEYQKYQEAQEIIANFLQEQEDALAIIDELKSKIDFLEQNNEQEQLRVKLNTAYDEISQLKKANENLNSQTYYLQEELNQLEQKEQFDVKGSEELSETYEIVEKLTKENDDLKGQITYLEDELDRVNENLHKKVDNIELVEEFKGQFEKEKLLLLEKIEHYEQIISGLENSVEYRDNQIEDLKEKLQHQTETNQYLHTIIDSEQLEELTENLELHEEKMRVKEQLSEQPLAEIGLDQSKSICVENLPQQYQRLLIERMFQIMNEYNKERFVDTLIQDLYHKNPEIRRFAIKVLSRVKSTKVFNALIDLLYDDDWLVRFYLVKALGTFKDFEGVNEVMKAFLNDTDVDVRKAARKVLENE